MFKQPRISLLGLLLLLLAAPAQGQWDDEDWCDDHRGDYWRHRARVCEVREFNLGELTQLDVDATPNGSISIVGYDGKEILVEARVSAWARDEADAEEIVRKIEIQRDGRLSADGPRQRRRESWSVSFRIRVPHSIDLRLDSMNGSIELEGIEGDIDMRSLNGSLSLTEVSGDVRGQTTNGRLNVQLQGKEWKGEGLDLVTTNGTINLDVPDGYNAYLSTSTTNGSIRTYFANDSRKRRHRGWGGRTVTKELGDGGAEIRLVTTNGSVRVRKKGS